MESVFLVDKSSMSEKELEAQHKRKEFIFIQKLSLAEEKGRGQEKEAIARNMLSAGMDVVLIAQLS